MGGADSVTEKKKWRTVAKRIGVSKQATNASFALRTCYEKHLQSYEKKYKLVPKLFISLSPADLPAVIGSTSLHRSYALGLPYNTGDCSCPRAPTRACGPGPTARPHPPRRSHNDDFLAQRPPRPTCAGCCSVLALF